MEQSPLMMLAQGPQSFNNTAQGQSHWVQNALTLHGLAHSLCYLNVTFLISFDLVGEILKRIKESLNTNC